MRNIAFCKTFMISTLIVIAPGMHKPSAEFGGGRGMHPPHQPKSYDFGQKISLNFEKLGSISGCIPPTNLNLTISAEKSVSISVKTFFFFWRPPDFGRENTFEFPISAEKSFSISVKTFFFFFFFLETT